jgi:hypothetical protein
MTKVVSFILILPFSLIVADMFICSPSTEMLFVVPKSQTINWLFFIENFPKGFFGCVSVNEIPWDVSMIKLPSLI